MYNVKTVLYCTVRGGNSHRAGCADAGSHHQRGDGGGVTSSLLGGVMMVMMMRRRRRLKYRKLTNLLPVYGKVSNDW